MKIASMIVLRPVCFFALLAFLVLLLPSVMIPLWYNTIKKIERDAKLSSQKLQTELLSQIESTAELLHPMNASAMNLARVLNASLSGMELPFSEIKNRVAPMLFHALAITPHVSQISYIGVNGLLFSYYAKGSEILALYSNSSISVNSSLPNATAYTWYIQRADSDTGKLYGEVITSPPSVLVNASWFQEAMNSTNGSASLGTGWNSVQDLIFLSTAKVNGRGAISLGFPVKAVIDFLSVIDLHGGSMCLATEDNKVLIEGLPNTHTMVSNGSISFKAENQTGDQISHVGNVSCKADDRTLKASVLNIGDKDYVVYCSQIEIMGVKSVYALAFPYRGLESLVHKNSRSALILLIVMAVIMVISVSMFVFLLVGAARREMYLRAVLIKQMDATQQAERKSMNKSLAFASASHDVRASLAGITGLIEISKDEVAPGSEIETNLIQMEGCTKDLLGLLNSILDTSKIEAGKMQLEEEEFNLEELLEDVVDLYHPVGMKKGIDVVLDPHDGSVAKFSRVKGDRVKLKQVLCNLLSNAVKFTSEGHVSIRAWAKKPSSESSVLASSQESMLNRLWRFFYKNNEAFSDLEAINNVRRNPNCMEFVFEVDDTGKGVPKEKQKSVFENYVQVKETALGTGGTGLGLGIVQSLVRLMGGEIGIVDKEIGEKGTCFRFNIFLTTCVPSDHAKEEDIEAQGHNTSSYSYGPLSVQTTANTVPSDHAKEENIEAQGHATSSYSYGPLRIRTTANQGLNILSSPRPSPRAEGSHVIILMQSNERRRIAQKLFETLGIKVSVVKEWERFSYALKKIRRKVSLSHRSSSGISEFSPRSFRSGSCSSNAGTKDMPLSAMDGTDRTVPTPRKTSSRGTPRFILILIEATAGPFPELWRAVAEFRKDLHNTFCRAVWLDKPTLRSVNLRDLPEEMISPYDLVILKPFHGSRLYQVVKLLPEFGGPILGISAISQMGKAGPDPSFFSPPTTNRTTPRKSQSRLRLVRESEIQEVGTSSNQNPLRGKRVLVAEDSIVLCKLAMAHVTRLGGTVEACDNGAKAVELVCNGLRNNRMNDASMILPYDYILMDCEMPEMDGYEATKRIREEEQQYGVHIPIIALTAHANGEEAKRTIDAGMDYHLSKPLKRETLMAAIEYMNSR